MSLGSPSAGWSGLHVLAQESSLCSSAAGHTVSAALLGTPCDVDSGECPQGRRVESLTSEILQAPFQIYKTQIPGDKGPKPILKCVQIWETNTRDPSLMQLSEWPVVFFSKKLSRNARFSLSLDPKLTLKTPNTFFLDQPFLTAWSCFLWQANASFSKTDYKQIPAIWKESQSKMTGPWLKGLP